MRGGGPREDVLFTLSQGRRRAHQNKQPALVDNVVYKKWEKQSVMKTTEYTIGVGGGGGINNIRSSFYELKNKGFKCSSRRHPVGHPGPKKHAFDPFAGATPLWW